MNNLIPVELIEKRIYLIRGQKVMLDRDLAELYGVETRTINQAVKRNIKRFPEDFMFQLSKEEFGNWRSQTVISNSARMGLRWIPFAFTEQGVAMLSSVLNSERAIGVNIAIMWVFVRIKQFISNYKELEQKLNALEEKHAKHLHKHDSEIRLIFDAIKQMLAIEEKPKKRIGFATDS
jgi:hypothetical protein